MHKSNKRKARSTLELSLTFPPVIFVAGPSGAGKSTLSEWVAVDLQFMHLEVDIWFANGIDVHGLRQEWKMFCRQFDPAPLASVLRDRVAAAKCSGAVLSFPSNVIFTRKMIDVARSVGIRTVVLYGPAQQCIDAYLARERTNGRGLGVERWRRFNARAHATYSRSKYADVRVEAFCPDGSRWSREHLVTIIRERVDGEPIPLKRLGAYAPRSLVQQWSYIRNWHYPLCPGDPTIAERPDRLLAFLSKDTLIEEKARVRRAATMTARASDSDSERK